MVVSANKWTGVGAVAELACRALRHTGTDTRLLFVGGRNLERRLTGCSWAIPGLAKERRPAHLRSNLRAVKGLAEVTDIVICHLPHDHLLCIASGIHRRVPLVRAFRDPRHVRRDPYHRYLNHRLSGTLLAYSAMRDALRPAVGQLPTAALPVPLDDRFHPANGSGWRDRLGIPPDAPTIGTIGKLAKDRGFCLLLDAASRIQNSAHVVVVGHGEFLPRLHEKAVHLGLKGRVHWTGYQDEGLPELYSAMDVVLFTAPGSDWGHRSISEAQGCGRPVVAVSHPGVEDLVVDGVSGRIVDRDPAAVAHVVDSLVAGRESAARLGNAATIAAESRWLAPIGERLASFLEEILTR
jgi:glycosyltransferase involved in cell wall biosynthesis